MKPQDIQIGKTYRNKGAGRTTRTVIDIEKRMTPHGYKAPTVLYEQPGRPCNPYTLTLKSFAAWAGSEVKP